MVKKPDSYSIEFRTSDHVLKPAERGLAGKIKAAVRQAIKSHLQGRVLAQGVTVITILITAGDLVDSLRQKLWNPMCDRRRSTGIGDAVGVRLKHDAELGFGLTQEQNTGIAGDVATLEIKRNFFSLNWGKGGNKRRRK